MISTVLVWVSPRVLLPILSFPPVEQIYQFTRPELSVPFAYLHKQLSKGRTPWSLVILPLVSMAILVVVGGLKYLL